jgi:hypothetical protein
MNTSDGMWESTLVELNIMKIKMTRIIILKIHGNPIPEKLSTNFPPVYEDGLLDLRSLR